MNSVSAGSDPAPRSVTILGATGSIGTSTVDLLRRDRVEARYARLTGHTPRDMDFHTLYAALRHAIVMLRIAYRRAHLEEVAVPADPDRLILHHDSLRAMVQGTYWRR